MQSKLVMLGDAAVGKSSIIARLISNSFDTTFQTTTSAAYVDYEVTVNDQKLTLIVWDTAGQERFAAVAPMYYRQAEIAVIVYDVGDRNTFQRASRLIQEVKDKSINPEIIIALVGNKCDLEQNLWQVTEQQGKSMAVHHNVQFMLVSAKSSANIAELFRLVSSLRLQLGNKDRDEIHEINVDEPKKRGCC